MESDDYFLSSKKRNEKTKENNLASYIKPYYSFLKKRKMGWKI